MNQEVIDFVEAEEDLLIDFQFLLQDVLNSKGLSKTELAKRAGISKARLSQILGAEANPNLKTFARLFHALGVKVEPRLVSLRNKFASIPQQRSEGKWEIGQVSKEIRLTPRQTARTRERASDWSGASNDNSLSVDASVRFLKLEAA